MPGRVRGDLGRFGGRPKGGRNETVPGRPVGAEILLALQNENSDASSRRHEPKVKSLPEPLDTQKLKCYTDLWTLKKF